MNSMLRLFNRFGSLNAQFQRNKSRNAVRFESQNIIWDHEEANFQTQALAKGLSSLNFQKGDNFLLRIAPAQQAEAYITKLGTAAIGANVILSKGRTESEIDEEIKSNNIKGIVFEPTLSVGQSQFIDVLNNLVPELARTRNGQKVSSSKYKSLSALIQTNFYSFPGVYKFRSVLNYATDKYFQIPNDQSFEPLSLGESDNTIFVTSPASDFGFRAGILNSNINGRYVVVVEPHNVNRIADFHDNKVDLVATEEIPNLSSQINIFVEKGSGLYQGRSNRVEL